MLYELRGRPSIAWEEIKPVRRNICTSRSFGYRIGDKDKMAEALANYAAACAAKMRAEKTCCRRLQVFIQTNPHKTEESSTCDPSDIDLERPSNHSGEIIKAALRGLDLIFTAGFLYMKCGVTVMDLVPESSVQCSCFDMADREKNGQVMDRSIGSMQLWEKKLIRSAVQGFDRKYRLKAEYLSPGIHHADGIEGC